jgi:hypothetical protein
MMPKPDQALNRDVLRTIMIKNAKNFINDQNNINEALELSDMDEIGISFSKDDLHKFFINYIFEMTIRITRFLYPAFVFSSGETSFVLRDDFVAYYNLDSKNPADQEGLPYDNLKQYLTYKLFTEHTNSEGIITFQVIKQC